MRLIDSHCHLQADRFSTDVDAVVQRARDAGVERILVPGWNAWSSDAALGLVERHPWLDAAVGVHPHDAAKVTPAEWERISALAADPRVVAIGETGLDYFYDHSPRDLQKAAFARFIVLARAVGKPVVCHIRDAHDDAREILTAGGVTDCVIHCFTGTPDDARAYAALGYYVSFSGIVTYKTAQPLRDAVPLVPRDRLLIETDCPYLAPIPKRGKRNEPAFLTHTAAVVAQCSGMSFDDLADATTRNACRIFGLAEPCHRA
jgi:TatD DNase family protein